MNEITHLDQRGRARMVDVRSRDIRQREAIASALVRTTPEVLRAITDNALPKGDVAAIARTAGILGAKQTPRLIPLCHPIALHAVQVDLELTEAAVVLTATTRTADRTGVEMEALTAVTIAGLTVIDMIKSLDPAAMLTDVRVDHKTGGRHGDWHRPTDQPTDGDSQIDQPATDQATTDQASIHQPATHQAPAEEGTTTC